MNELSSERTPQVIAAEINTMTNQSKKILLSIAVEIGRRLKEAKELIKYGEWGKWLKESVSYSKSTAANLMRLYEEYGQSISEDSPDFQPVGNLTYTQALLLLGLPEEERKEFIAQNDVAGMTKQELQQVLKDRDQAQQENKVLKKGLETIEDTLTELKKEQTEALPQPAAASPSGDTSATEDTSPASSTLPELPANFTHNLATEPDPNAAVKYVEKCDTCCKTIADTFFELTIALTYLTSIDSKLKEEKRKEAQKLLDSIAEQIKEWPPVPKRPKARR